MVAKVLILLLTLNLVYQNVATSSNIQTFVCEKSGYFENPSDLSCRTFYQCITFLGSLIPVSFTCPIFTNFDPKLQICSLSYACPSNKSLIAAERRSDALPEVSLDNDYPIDPHMEVIRSCTRFKCTSEGIFEDPDTCGKYYVCSKFFESYVVTHNPCPVFAGFDPVYRMCSFSKTCLPPIERCIPQDQHHKEESCIYVDYQDYFQCKRPGYFRNLNDPTCETYHYCKPTEAGGMFIKETYRCPNGSHFNPYVKKCDTNYICPCSESNSATVTTNIPGIDDEEENMREVVKKYESSLKVTEVDSESACMSFIVHNRSDNAADRNIAVDLSETSNREVAFHSKFSLESLHNIYPEWTNYTKCTPSTSESFECWTKGRFLDPGDTSCQNYFLCNLLRNGSFVKTRYSCPKGSSFNPSSSVCDIQYNCPCDVYTTTLPSSTIDESALSKLTSMTESDGSFSTEASSCNYQKSPDYFTCNKKGRFENLNDLTCESYFLCNLLRNGSFLKTEYLCPKGSYFNPTLSICSKSYTCPCNSATTTSTSAATVIEETTEISSVATTTEQNHCRYEDNPDYFTCSEKGRFEDLNDLTCQSYYLCNLLKNGSFVKTRYSCPKGSSFNPPLGVCDTQYACPCVKDVTTISSSTTGISESSTTENGFTKPDDSATTEAPVCDYKEDPEYYGCTSKGRFENLNDLNCESYFLCNLLRNGSFLKTKYICPKGSYFNPNLSICSKSYICPCNGHITVSSTTASSTATEETTEQKRCRYEDNPEYFTCSEKGRFEDLNDLTCQSYYLCNLLKNGSFVKTRYSCPKGSSFNPPLGVCDTQYVCPCVEDVTTTSRSTTDITESSTTTENGFTKPDDSATTEAPVCDYKEEPEYYGCTSKGRFENLNDLNCESYFLCNLLRNGSFLKTKYVCPNGSYFNPNLSICSKSYICPCNGHTTVSSTTASSTPTEETTEQKRCRYKDNPEYFTCSEKGRFEDLSDLTCQSYYLCNLLKNGSFVKTRYACPKGSGFNPSLGVCDTQYVCPCVEDVTTISSSTTDITEPSTTTEKVFTKPDDSATTETPVCDYQEDPEYYDCTSKGRFENLNDLNCESYFLCNLLRNGSFLKTKYVCPKDSYFNPNLSICSKSYICPCNGHITASSTTVSSTATEETTEISSVSTTTEQKHCRYEDNPEYFTCSEKGRFEDLNDLTCQSYHLCNLLKNGSFVKTRYACPKGSGFNPSLGVCDTQYVCPCVEDATTVSSSTTNVNEPSTTSETIITEPDDEVATEVHVCDYQEDPEYFNCTGKGRFENLNDLNCESYFLCNLLRNSSFLKTKYVCPKGSYFNPNLSICSKSYICPCNSRMTTEPTTVFSTVTENTEVSSEADDVLTTEGVVCDYQQDPEYFTCAKKGRFENLNDLACETYFLCNLLRNGSFLKTKYSCPKGSYFNPSLNICSTNYICPCSSRITTESPNEYNATTEANTAECSTSAESACVYKDDPDYFSCTINGSFANHNDPTCKTFFLCNLLGNGTFIKTRYSCPKGLFNPDLSLCDSNFSCPCSEKNLDKGLSDFSSSPVPE